MSEESQSAFSASNSKVEREEDFKAYADEDGQPMVEIPKKPASAYTLIFILCLFIAFGGSFSVGILVLFPVLLLRKTSSKDWVKDVPITLTTYPRSELV